MDKTDRLRDYGLAFLLYEHGLGICGYELIRELFIFIKLILNSYLHNYFLFKDCINAETSTDEAVVPVGLPIVDGESPPSKEGKNFLY